MTFLGSLRDQHEHAATSLFDSEGARVEDVSQLHHFLRCREVLCGVKLLSDIVELELWLDLLCRVVLD